MPLAFTENRGQWDERVKFRANAGGATMWFTETGAYYQFTRRIPSDGTDVTLSSTDMTLSGDNVTLSLSKGGPQLAVGAEQV